MNLNVPAGRNGLPLYTEKYTKRTLLVYQLEAKAYPRYLRFTKPLDRQIRGGSEPPRPASAISLVQPAIFGAIPGISSIKPVAVRLRRGVGPGAPEPGRTVPGVPGTAPSGYTTPTYTRWSRPGGTGPGG